MTSLTGHVDEVTWHQVIGWVADPAHPDCAIDVLVIVDGRVRAQVRADEMREGLAGLFPGATGRYEFRHAFEPPLSATRDHIVEIVLADGFMPVDNGHRTLAARSAERFQLTPVILTSCGRSGTTLLMREFAQQDAMLVADTYPYEVKMTAYHAAVLWVLSHPRFRTDGDAAAFADLAFRQVRATANPWNQPDLHQLVGGPHLVGFFRDSVPARLADLLRGIVLDYYGIVGRAQNKTSARYFVEKGVANEAARLAMRRLFGTLRELVMVRDPRDYLCSAKAFWKLDTHRAFETMRAEFPVLGSIDRQPDEHVMFVRYEDLLLHAPATRRGIHAFLDLNPADIRDLAPDPALLRRHATTSDPRASIGRWKRELSAAEISACEREFDPFLTRFGYRD